MDADTFGKTLKNFRLGSEFTLKDLSKKIGKHWTYLSKIENDKKKPTLQLLKIIANSLNLADQQYQGLCSLLFTRTQMREGVNYEMQNQAPSENQNKQVLNINIPQNLAVLYSDMIAVTSSAYGITLDVGQKLGATNNHNIVARIGISLSHAKDFLKVLSKEISNAEKAQKLNEEKMRGKEN